MTSFSCAALTSGLTFRVTFHIPFYVVLIDIVDTKKLKELGEALQSRAGTETGDRWLKALNITWLELQ